MLHHLSFPLAEHRPRILLVTMPLSSPLLPCLAIEQLAAAARRESQACDVLYGTLHLPESVPSHIRFSDRCGATIFAPSYYGMDPVDLADEIQQFVASTVSDLKEKCLIEFGMDYLLAADAANLCLARCMAAIDDKVYDVIGFSVGFDAQKLASAALARRLKQRNPNVRILFGGTACDGPMGPAMMRHFPEIDAIVQGDADLSFLPAVAALRDQIPFEQTTNCLYRQSSTVCQSPRAPFVQSLDLVPRPDYAAYLHQRQASEYRHHPLTLLFETSRGCWWGQKHHCRFCGLRADGLSYRTKSPSVAVQEILELQDKYKPYTLYSTDGILDAGYLRTVLPELAVLRRNKRFYTGLFFEVKSNLTRSQVALLARAGVRCVQPGIESLSTHVLRGMNKGCTAMQNVQLLKWLEAYDVAVIWGILTGTPDEQLEDLTDMTRIASRIHHLPPPRGVNRLMLTRFSPFAANPAQFGICDVRAHDTSRLVFRNADDALRAELCYDHEYALDPPRSARHVEALAQLAAAVIQWQNAYCAGERLRSDTVSGRVVVTRRASSGAVQTIDLVDMDAHVYRACEQASTMSKVAWSLRRDELEVAKVLRRLAGAYPSPTESYGQTAIRRNRQARQCSARCRSWK